MTYDDSKTDAPKPDCSCSSDDPSECAGGGRDCDCRCSCHGRPNIIDSLLALTPNGTESELASLVEELFCPAQPQVDVDVKHDGIWVGDRRSRRWLTDTDIGRLTAWLVDRSKQELAEAERPKYIDVVFDGPPGPTAGHFIEVEDEHGRSINVGEWIDRKDGYFALRIPRSLVVTDA